MAGLKKVLRRLWRHVYLFSIEACAEQKVDFLVKPAQKVPKTPFLGRNFQN